MNKKTPNIYIYVILSLGLVLVVNEIIFQNIRYFQLKSENFAAMGVNIKELVNNWKTYLESQRIGLMIAALNHSFVLYKYAGFILYTRLISCVDAKHSSYGRFSKRCNVLSENVWGISRTEITYVAGFLTMSFHIAAISTLVGGVIFQGFLGILAVFCSTLLLFCVFGPLVALIVIKLLKKGGAGLVILVWCITIIQSLFSLYKNKEFNSTRCHKVSMDEFSFNIVNYLKKNNLDDKVFEPQIITKGENVVLVGLGEYAKILILGKKSNYPTEELESILLHEAGHKEDKSIVRSIVAAYVVKCLSFACILYIWYVASPKYSNEILSRESAFLILLLLFSSALSDIFNPIEFIVSQIGENNADAVAKKNGLGPDLAKALLHLGSRNCNLVDSMGIYNIFYCTHPTTLSRVKKMLE